MAQQNKKKEFIEECLAHYDSSSEALACEAYSIFKLVAMGFDRDTLISEVKNRFAEQAWTHFIPFSDIKKITGRDYRLLQAIKMKKEFRSSFSSVLRGIYDYLKVHYCLLHRSKIGSNKELFAEHRPTSVRKMREVVADNVPVDDIVEAMVDLLKEQYLAQRTEGARLSKAHREQITAKVREYIWHLLTVEFFCGWILEDVVSQYVASEFNTPFTSSTDEEDSSFNIDGFIDGIPVSIKPYSFTQRQNYYPPSRQIVQLTYQVVEDGLIVEFEQLWKKITGKKKQGKGVKLSQIVPLKEKVTNG